MAEYGKFNAQDEFEIFNPYTPEPWLHYLIRPDQPGTQTFCSGVSYTGGGFDVRGTHENTFVDTQLHLNDADNKGRYCYIVDAKTRDYFTPTWQPVKREGQEFKAVLGFGYIKFNSLYKGIKTEETMFVPKEFDGWVQNIVIENTTNETKELEIYPFVPIHMGDALIRLLAGDNDGFFGGANWDKDLNAIVFRRNHGTSVNDNQAEINGMLGNVAAFVCTLNTANTEYETNEERFTGDRFHSLENPLRIIDAEPLSNTNQAYLRRTCGVFRNKITLEAGKKTEFAIALIASSTKDYYLNKKNYLTEMTKMIQCGETREKMLCDVIKWWDDMMSQFTISTPSAKINRAFKWLQYQCYVVYTLNRMKSRYHTGYEYGWGFRDILQDVNFNLPYSAETVKSALKHIATQMFLTGVSYHNFFIDQPGNKSIQASDDPIWLPMAIIKYIKETGNFAFLDEKVAYAEVHEKEDEAYGTILEHIQKAIDRVWTDRSDRDLPYMKDCDWNDDLNELRTGGEWNKDVESVMVAQQLYKVLIDTADLLKAANREASLAGEYLSRAKKLYDAITQYAIDKEGYYIRALSRVPEKKDLGRSENVEAKIFLEPQTFGINCETADTHRAKIVIKKVEEYLDSEFGAQICFPVYNGLAEREELPTRTWNVEKEPPAMKENGSIFMHLNAWLVQSYAILNRGTDAVNYYEKCLPENLASDQDRYKSEPYIYPEYVRGRGGYGFGQGGHTWLTGTAPTMHQSLTEWILGLQPEYDGLKVNPKISKDWKEFTIKRNFRGAAYEIVVKNPNGLEHGVKIITVDGTEILGNLIKPHSDGKLHKIEVVLGTGIDRQ
jgi:cellobiose phosphorylase